MMAAPRATPKQIGFIHGLAGRAGMDEDTRREFLEREAGVRSCKQLTAAAADRVITKLQAINGGRSAVAGLDTPLARKLRALWIAGWNLGLVRDRNDRAMLVFLERQTGVSHTRFLQEPGAGRAAVEGLKGWLARDGGVAWPGKEADAVEFKRAVLTAQWSKLVALGEVKPFDPLRPLLDLDRYAFRVAHKQGWCFFDLADHDLVGAALGRKLRGALARRSEAAAPRVEDAA